MSRVGNKPINIPEDVKINIEDSLISVKGKKGELSQEYRSDFDIQKKDDTIVIERPDETKTNKSLHGLYRKLVQNMIEGVTKGFEKK